MRESGEDGRLAAFDVNLDERWNAEPGNQQIEGCGLDLEAAVPAHAGEIGLARARVAPRGGERRHCRRAFTDRQRRTAWRVTHGCLDDLDSRRAAEEHAQQLREVGLRLERHDTTAERRERARAIAGMRADIEDEVAGSDQLSVQATQAELPQRDRVVDRERACEADGAVKAAHVRRVTTSGGDRYNRCKPCGQRYTPRRNRFPAASRRRTPPGASRSPPRAARIGWRRPDNSPRSRWARVRNCAPYPPDIPMRRSRGIPEPAGSCFCRPAIHAMACSICTCRFAARPPSNLSRSVTSVRASMHSSPRTRVNRTPSRPAKT